MNVSEIGRRCGLSRGTLLYYESLGLLKPCGRSPANYRRYEEHDLARLRQICVYREAGLSLADIRTLLERQESDAGTVLKRRLSELNGEIEALRAQQRAILKLLQHTDFGRLNVITKDRWVEIMKAAGMTQEEMHRWHVEFERHAPAEHQEFLEFLHISPDEIRTIRDRSRQAAK